MSEVGIRELRDHLSRYLDQVRGGEEVVVTAHGRAVAKLVAIDETRPIDRLIAEGVVTRARSDRRRLPSRRLTVPGGVSDLVAEQRQ